MGFLKSFLTSENIKILDFNVSTFILVSIVVFFGIFIFFKLNRRRTRGKWLDIILLTFEIMSLWFVLFYSLTGEDLFSQKENFRIYMFILAGVLAERIKKEFKETFNN